MFVPVIATLQAGVNGGMSGTGRATDRDSHHLPLFITQPYNHQPIARTLIPMERLEATEIFYTEADGSHFHYVQLS